MSDADDFLPCPLCKAAAPVEVQRQRLALAGLDTVDIGFGYCRTCGHIYPVRTVSDALLSRHYEQFSNYTAFDPEAARAAPAKASTLRLLHLAEAHTGQRGLAYEVGCATGFHLAQFARAGWRVAGCDLSPKGCAQARSILGVEAACGPEAEILPKRKNLDLVYFSHVLEHLRDPMAALDARPRCARQDDGLVMLEVPCAVAAHRLPPGWFTFEHLHYFSEDALSKMLDHAGFKALEIRIALKAELYPVIAAIAVKGDHCAFAAEPWAVARTQSFLAEFTARDENLWNDVAKRVGNLSGGIFIWGAGVHTACN